VNEAGRGPTPSAAVSRQLERDAVVISVNMLAKEIVHVCARAMCVCEREGVRECVCAHAHAMVYTVYRMSEFGADINHIQLLPPESFRSSVDVFIQNDVNDVT
jgi:hypothetical protein